MSREIDLTKKLTEDDLRYLVDRDRWDDLRTNAENLGLPEPNLPSPRGIRMQVPAKQLKNTDAFDKIADQLGVQVSEAGDVPTSPPSGPQSTDYNKLTVPQLKEELDKRRAEYEKAGDSEAVKDVTYDAKATKQDLIAQLQLDDEATSE